MAAKQFTVVYEDGDGPTATLFVRAVGYRENFDSNFVDLIDEHGDLVFAVASNRLISIAVGETLD